MDIDEVSTNVIPFQDLDYLNINQITLNNHPLRSTFVNGFSENWSPSVNLYLKSGIFLASAALLRTKKYDLEEVRDAIRHVKKSMKFPIWSTGAWKVGLTTNTDVTKTDGQLTSLPNSTSTNSFLNF